MKTIIDTAVIVKTHVTRFKVELSSSSVQFEVSVRVRSNPMIDSDVAAQILEEGNSSVRRTVVKCGAHERDVTIEKDIREVQG